MDLCTEYFDKKRIPYHIDTLKYVISKRVDGDIIIPGCIIKCKSENSFSHFSSNKRLINYVDNILQDEEVINSGHSLYIFVDVDDKQLSNCKQQYIDAGGVDIRFINSMKDIPLIKTIFFVATCGPFWSMMMDNEYLEEYSEEVIYAFKSVYNASIAIANDDEL